MPLGRRRELAGGAGLVAGGGLQHQVVLQGGGQLVGRLGVRGQHRRPAGGGLAAPGHPRHVPRQAAGSTAGTSVVVVAVAVGFAGEQTILLGWQNFNYISC